MSGTKRCGTQFMDIYQYLAWQSEKIIEVEPGF